MLLVLILMMIVFIVNNMSCHVFKICVKYCLLSFEIVIDHVITHLIQSCQVTFFSSCILSFTLIITLQQISLSFNKHSKTNQFIQLLCNFMESLSNIFNITSIQTSNGNTTIHSQIDMIFINTSLNLFLS